MVQDHVVLFCCEHSEVAGQICWTFVIQPIYRINSKILSFSTRLSYLLHVECNFARSCIEISEYADDLVRK